MKEQQNENKIDFKQAVRNRVNSLFFRTYMSFAGIILFFAVLLGSLYMNMYNRTIRAGNQEELVTKGDSIAARCGHFFIEKLNYESEGDNFDANQAVENWLNYVIMLRDVEKTETWAISNPSANFPLSSSMAVSLDSPSLSQDFKDWATVVFNDGQRRIGTNYSSLYGSMVMSFITPVYGVNSEVCGVIIVYNIMTTEQEVINQSFKMIIVSVFVALLISFGITIPIVRAITRPISVINNTALKLAKGNFTVKTRIKRNDEVGQLAESVDYLAIELKKADDERRNNEQLRLDFFANVSHELRTPITVVRAYAESLADGMVEDPEKIKQYYERMLNECDSMQRLVGDLLTLSKMQNPDFVVDKEMVNVQQVFNDIFRSAKTLGKEKSVHIRLDMCEEPCMMMADYMRLRQMFMVIIDNAIKFSPEDGIVTIKVTFEDEIKISISDQGVGISEEDLPYIFEKFYRSKLRENAKGTGLGLPIAKYICLKHDGRIEVSSEKGVGTTFNFYFPAEVKLRNKFDEI